MKSAKIFIAFTFLLAFAVCVSAQSIEPVLKETNYLKLSEQYASFLVAVAGVSITVLALVLTFSKSKINSYLINSLITATVSCFAGAHMMAETAAFTSHSKGIDESGERLFLLASTNIFISVVLIIFALVLLPINLKENELALIKQKKNELAKITQKGSELTEIEQKKNELALMVINKLDIKDIKPTLIWAFGLIVSAVLFWMWRVSYRMPAPNRGWLIFSVAIVTFLLAMWMRLGMKYEGICNFLCKTWEELEIKKFWQSLCQPFVQITILIFFPLFWFGCTFKNGSDANCLDIILFSFAVSYTCASLSVIAVEGLRKLKLSEKG